MNKQYKIVQASQSNQCELPNTLMKSFGFRDKDSIKLRFGSAITTLQVLGSERNHIGIGKHYLSILGVPQNLMAQVRKIAPDELRLGPVIGLLTFSNYIPDRLHYYERWYNNHLNGGLLFVFRGSDMLPKINWIKGYYYNPAEKVWECKKFPFPDVVIDRCYPGRLEYHKLLEDIIGPGKLFNKHNLISKTNFAKTLVKDQFLQEFIPETHRYRKIENLNYFLEKYGQAFLKPVASMKGAGIIVVTKLVKGLECRYNAAGADTIKIIGSTSEFPEVFKSVSPGKKKYIIQQPIRSVKIQGGPLSFRVCPMKNGANRWVVPGFVPLGSMGEGYTTNYSSGGKTIPLNTLLDHLLPLLPYDKTALINLLHGLAIKTAICLDKKYGPLGDLGIDIVIDRDGKPWLLEANGNPAKIAAFLENDFPAWRNLTYQYPLDYARYLAGFSTNEALN